MRYGRSWLKLPLYFGHGNYFMAFFYTTYPNGAVYELSFTTQQPASQSTMLHSTVVMVAMFSISFSLGVCFTLGCFYLQACCKPKQGPRNQKTKPIVVPQPPTKRARPSDTPTTSQPAPKRARSMDHSTPTARHQGHAKPAIVTIPWPIPSKLP